MEAIYSSMAIVTLKFMNCKILLSEANPLGQILSNGEQNWEVIEISGCNIEDKGCFTLYQCFSANKNLYQIKLLNLSFNYLTQDAVITILKIFHNCIIETLIISRNDISSGTFKKALQYFLLDGKPFLNFAHKVPLLVYESGNEQPPCEA